MSTKPNLEFLILIVPTNDEYDDAWIWIDKIMVWHYHYLLSFRDQVNNERFNPQSTNKCLRFDKQNV